MPWHFLGLHKATLHVWILFTLHKLMRLPTECAHTLIWTQAHTYTVRNKTILKSVGCDKVTIKILSKIWSYGWSYNGLRWWVRCEYGQGSSYCVWLQRISEIASNWLVVIMGTTATTCELKKSNCSKICYLILSLASG